MFPVPVLINTQSRFYSGFSGGRKEAGRGGVVNLTPPGGQRATFFSMSIMNNSCLTLMVFVVCSTSQMWR